MKKLIIFFLLIFIFIPSIKGNSAYKIKDDYIIAFKKYDWIKWELYCWINYYSCKYNLPPLLVCAVIEQESDGQKYIRGEDGEYGYMQPLPCHFKGVPYKLRFEPEYNIKIGCWYLMKAYKKARGNILHTYRYYNAGLGNKKYEYKNWKAAKKVVKDYKDSLNYRNKIYASIL